MKFADLILPLPLPGVFTYSVPEQLQGEVSPGKRVLVQFGRKKIYSSVVKNLHNEKPLEYKTKDILSVLDDKPMVMKIQLRFWEWVASYYMCQEGDVLKAAMPGGLRLESETRLVTNPEFTEDTSLSVHEFSLFRFLENSPLANISVLSRAAGDKPVYSLVKSLIEKKAVLASESFKSSFKPKTDSFLSLHPNVDSEENLKEVLSKLERAPRQLGLLMNYLNITGLSDFGVSPPEIQKNLVAKNLKNDAVPLKALLGKKILAETRHVISRLKPEKGMRKELSKLNSHQEVALENIKTLFAAKDVVLLNGITAAGKTEIYIHLITEELKKGRQVLYLLPEIALTTQIIVRLKTIFGNQAGVYHSKFSDSERVEIWNNVLSDDAGSYRLILGVRSSLFCLSVISDSLLLMKSMKTPLSSLIPLPATMHAIRPSCLLRCMGQKPCLVQPLLPLNPGLMPFRGNTDW